MTVLDFIDSEAVRKYNRDYIFDPAEQGLLCYISEKAAPADKAAFLKNLLAGNPDAEDFVSDRVHYMQAADQPEKNLKPELRSMLTALLSEYVRMAKGEVIEEPGKSLQAFLLEIPLPFRKGDIVVCRQKYEDDLVDGPAGTVVYGVVRNDAEYALYTKNTGAVRSMDVEFFDGAGFTELSGAESMRLEFCPDEELPDEAAILKWVSEIRKGNMDFMELVELLANPDMTEEQKQREFVHWLRKGRYKYGETMKAAMHPENVDRMQVYPTVMR